MLKGVARRVWYDNEIQEGQFVDGKLHGFGRICFESGAYYIGMYKNGKKNGHGKMVYPGGNIFEGRWKDSQFIGPSTIFNYS